jgi:hypothetical protein
MKTLKTVRERHKKFKDSLKIIEKATKGVTGKELARGWMNACQSNFRLFVYRFCLHLFWGQPGVLHDDSFDIADAIADSTNKLGDRHKSFFENIIAPRGNAKSTIWVICFTVFQVLYKREKLILLVTNNASKAKENLKNILALLRNPAIQGVFNPIIDKANSDELLVNSCKIISKSINQDIRGINEEGTRLTLCIGDDIESEEMGNSPTQRENNYRTWTDAIEPAATPATFPIQTSFILVNTALHPECLVVKLQESSRYNSRIYPAVISEPTQSALWQEFDRLVLNVQDEIDRSKRIENAKKFYAKNKKAMDEGLEINWEAGEPYWSLRIFRLEKGLATFNREKQGNPINPAKLKFASYLIDDEKLREEILFKIQGRKIIWGDREFDLATLNRWAFFDGAEGKSYTKGCYASLTVMAHSKTESERRNANSILGVVTGLDFVVDNLLMRERDEVQAEKILLRCQYWNVTYLCIESSTFQGMYSTLLRMKAKELREKGLLDPAYKLTIIPITPIAQKESTNKLDYIDNILTSLAFAPNTCKFSSDLNGEFFKQLTQYPTGKYLDGPDSLAGALYFYYLFSPRAQSEKFQKQIQKI